ncbi:MAG: cytochrome o ubiquinol oxidase subunit IV [Caulobacteraceae bacterium]|nr:cytochrome o ubiquinol oxidase subunit IV [Caulobacteraceae bacterium]
MSAKTLSAHNSNEPTATRREYFTGFALAAILTAIPFSLVMCHVISGGAAATVILALAAVQVVVHMIYFLHMNSRVEGGWSLMALLFTALMVGIVLVGSLWVMHNMEVNMAPMPAMPASP